MPFHFWSFLLVGILDPCLVYMLFLVVSEHKSFDRNENSVDIEFRRKQILSHAYTVSAARPSLSFDHRDEWYSGHVHLGTVRMFFQ